MSNGVVLALAAYAVYAWGDGIIKALGGRLSVFEIGFFNTLIAGTFMLLIKPGGRDLARFLAHAAPWAVHARAISGLVGGILGVFAFTTVPLAEVLRADLHGAAVCHAAVDCLEGTGRALALVRRACRLCRRSVGGAARLPRPGTWPFRGLIVAFLAAVTIILMRSLAQEKQTTMLGVLLVYSLVFNGAFAAATSFTIPGWHTLALLILVGACTACGHRLQLLATRRAPANQIAPTHYSQMIWAVLIGAIFFNEFAGPLQPGRIGRDRLGGPADAAARAHQARNRALEPVRAKPAVSGASPDDRADQLMSAKCHCRNALIWGRSQPEDRADGG